MDKDRITKLNYAYDLDGGGYTWSEVGEDYKGFPEGTGALVMWESPDLDYFTGVDVLPRGKYGYRRSADVLFFAPNSGHFPAYVFPDRIRVDSDDGPAWMDRIAQGQQHESDHSCTCHGRKDAESGAWDFTGNTNDKPLPDCERCDGDGYVKSDGGEWAIYEWAEEKDEPEDDDTEECPDCEDGHLVGENQECDACDYGHEDEWEPIDYDDYPIDGVGFADPGGRSALRAETEDNPRDQDCRSCGRKNVLTRIDRQRGYCCNTCADQNERGGY